MPYAIKKSIKNRKRDGATSGKLVTFEEFYEIVDEKTKADLLDGLIIRDSPGMPPHARVATWLTRLLADYAERFDLGEVLTATVTVRLTAYNAPEPDIMFVRKSRLYIINDKYVNGPPDLCVEVISKSSRKYDRGRKFVLYAEHGVKEYWIVDPFRTTVEFYTSHDGEFELIEPDEQGRLHSQVLPGLWLKPEWLAADALPPLRSVLEEILAMH